MVKQILAKMHKLNNIKKIIGKSYDLPINFFKLDLKDFNTDNLKNYPFKTISKPIDVSNFDVSNVPYLPIKLKNKVNTDTICLDKVQSISGFFYGGANNTNLLIIK